MSKTQRSRRDHGGAGQPALARPRPSRHLSRTRSVGTKVTDDEYEVIASAAGTQRISEWLRRVALTTAAAEPADRVLLGELLALRAILLTLHFSVAAGERLTREAMQRLIDRADHDKDLRAQMRLAAPSSGGRS